MKPDEPIQFEYVSSETDDDRLRCPICKQITPIHDQETYYRQDSEQRIECCTRCREDFERATDVSLEADVLNNPVFDEFQSWARGEIQDRPDERTGINDETAPVIARILSAEAWNSGGGIWLVIKRREDGSLVALSDEAVCVYSDDTAFGAGRADNVIQFHTK